MATIKEGIKVNKEKTEIYLRLVLDPDLFFFSCIVESIKIFKN